MKTRSQISKFNEWASILSLYSIRWGLEERFSYMQQAADEQDTDTLQTQARRMLLDLPSVREVFTSGYYMLEDIGEFVLYK